MQKHINGYFVVFTEEKKIFETKFEKNEPIVNGRLGIFYKENKLLEEIEKHKINQEIFMISVSIPKNAILHSSKKKFGFVSNKEIQITALKQIEQKTIITE